MKKLTLTILAGIAGMLTGCESVDDVLKPSDEITVTLLETQDTVRTVPGDTLHLHFMVSTSNGSITRFELDGNPEVVELHPEKASFGLTDNELGLSADEQGNLSREVSSLIIDYPMYVKPGQAILSGVQEATFRAFNKQGKQDTKSVRFVGVNYRKKTGINTTVIDDSQTKGKYRFFSASDFRAYAENRFVNDTIPEDSLNEEAKRIRGSIDFVFGFTNPVKYFLYSPANPQAEEYLTQIGIKGYDATKMNATTFYHLDGVGGSHLNEAINNETDNNKKQALITERQKLDKEFFETVDDAYLKQLEYSQAVDYIDLIGGFYAFRTHDKRHGIIWISYPNVFGNPLPIKVDMCIIEAVASEGNE